MNLQDATLVFLAESASFPTVAELAKSARDQLLAGEPADYRVLDDLLGEASGKGILRAMARSTRQPPTRRSSRPSWKR